MQYTGCFTTTLRPYYKYFLLGAILLASKNGHTDEKRDKKFVSHNVIHGGKCMALLGTMFMLLGELSAKHIDAIHVAKEQEGPTNSHDSDDDVGVDKGKETEADHPIDIINLSTPLWGEEFGAFESNDEIGNDGGVAYDKQEKGHEDSHNKRKQEGQHEQTKATQK